MILGERVLIVEVNLREDNRTGNLFVDDREDVCRQEHGGLLINEFGENIEDGSNGPWIETARRFVQKRTAGSWRSAWIRPSFWRIPLELVEIRRSASSVTSRRAKNSSIRAAGAVRAEEPIDGSLRDCEVEVIEPCGLRIVWLDRSFRWPRVSKLIVL